MLPTLLQWLLLHTLAGLTIGALEASQFQFMATLIFSGLLVGVAQWFVLRHVLRKAFRWIWVSAIGWLIGVQLMIWLGGWLDLIVAHLTQLGGGEVFWLNVVKQPIALLGMGTAQSLLLPSLWRRTGEKARCRWIVASGIAGAIQGGSSALFCATFCPAFTGQLGTILTTAIVYGVGWFSYSAIVAFLLYKLLFSSASEHS
ncbi:hypothetical protein H6F87_02020 [Cyanobacteria bacterium FACHB-502]|nr:hypothetical protein [Cyanobacteria bacterium FACHB-502]